jgi:integrase
MAKAFDRFLSGVRSEASKKLYSYRMTAFLDSVKMDPEGFAKLPSEAAEELIETYIQALKERADRKEISKGTVRSSITPIRAFCVMNRMKGIDWAILAKTVPTAKKYASDRAPTLEEVKLLLNHCPLRLKAAILMQLSGGFRSGAFDFLTVQDVEPSEDGIAKVTIYRGEPEEYRTYITPEAFIALKEYLSFRASHGEKVTPQSPLFRNSFDSGRGCNGTAENVKPMQSQVYGRDLNRLWHKSGVWSETLDLTKGGRRQRFKATHGFRKLFKSIAEEHMRSLNVLRLQGHSAGVSGDSYYRPKESEVLEDYKGAVQFLTVSAELRQHEEMKQLEAHHEEGDSKLQLELLKEREQRRGFEERVAKMEEYITIQMELQRRKAEAEKQA